jgi:hypothetical protein
MQRYEWPAPADLLIWGRLLRGALAADQARERRKLLTTSALAAAAGFQSVHGARTAYRRHAQVTLLAIVEQGTVALDQALISAFPPVAG